MSKSTLHHCALDVRGVLTNWPDRMLRRLFRVDGRWVSAREARAFLVEQLAQGNVLLPMSDECPDFDQKGGGCPGHEEGA